jgi:protein phosphatase PTC7
VRRAAESKQEEYRRAAAARQQQEQESQKRGGGGILSALLLGDDEDDREDSLSSVATAEKKEEWFDFLSDRPPAASSPAAEPAEAPRQKSDSDWFGWGKAREGKAVRADWFASFGTSAADGPPAGSDVAVGESAAEELSFSAAAEEAGTLIEEKKVKEEADWFSWFQPKGESGRDADVPGTAVGASAPTAAVEEAPTTAAEPAPTEPAEKQPEAEPQKPRPSVLGKLFGSVPAVSVDIPKPLGAERIKPDAVVEKPRPVVLEKPEPAVVEKPKPAAIVEPPPKKEDRRAAAVEVGAPPAVIAPEMSTYVLPDPKKLFWGGEDAVFVRGRTFGVFDGVSGADKLDGLPLYSITLAREMKSRVGVDGLQVKDMVDLLSESVEVANQRATGASTALVGSIGEDGVLQVLNVGDSTAVVVRENKVVARTREINHFYECPYQFSTSSPDRPRDGTRLRLALKRGDVIIAGSDGVFDNLEEEQILDELRKSPKKASVIAKRVSDLSRRVSQNPKAVTPFSRLALQKKNPDYPDGVGGKVDDVCCVAICYG